MVLTQLNIRSEPACIGACNDDALRHGGVGLLLAFRQVFGRPRGYDLAGIAGVFFTTQQVVSLVEADEALRMLRGSKQPARIVQFHDGIERGMQDHHRFSEASH